MFKARAKTQIDPVHATIEPVACLHIYWPGNIVFAFARGPLYHHIPPGIPIQDRRSMSVLVWWDIARMEHFSLT